MFTAESYDLFDEGVFVSRYLYLVRICSAMRLLVHMSFGYLFA